MLFLSDTAYPGWKAFVNGIETKWFPANLSFRALYLEAGEHVVEFKYIPKSFWSGLLFTIFTTFFCLFFLIK